MESYLIVSDNNKGKLGVSEYVFKQITNDTITNLISNSLKDSISLTYGHKKCKTSVSIGKKNEVIISIELAGIKNQDISSAVKKVQEDVYSNISSMFEISSLKINVSLVGIIEKK
jgi:uncharacterized alkaline shock family protein YloU